MGDIIIMKNRILLFFALCMFVPIVPAMASARSVIEQIGDYTQVIVPAYAFGLAMNEDGWVGARQFAASFVSMEIAVNGLKGVVNEPRPDRSNNNSFPSGHTAAAVSGATFIHKRYGLKQAAIPYALAAFTGFSRVYADRHYIHDVIAGAAIGGLLSWTLTSRADSGTDVAVNVGADGVGFNFKTHF